MDRASRVLSEGLPEGMPNTYAALAAHGDVPLSTLHHRARGRRSRAAKAQSQQYLTPHEEKALIEYLIRMNALGQPVRMKYIAAIAFSATRQRPEADRPLKPPGVNWAKRLDRRHPELTARKNRPQDWSRYNIYDKVVHWFEVIGKELQNPAVLPENVYNMDETGIMLSMLNSVKVLVGKDDARGYRGARVKRTMVTAIECISADGGCLNPMIIWPASTHRANWTTYPTHGWVYACSDSGFTDSYISLQWLKLVFDAQTKQRANGKPRILIWDGFGTHETLEILEYCFENNIILCRMPSHTSHKLQPCDVAIFGPLKAAYREQVERMDRGGVNIIGKQHFTYLYSPAREKALTKRNILAAWRGSGLFPFNPDRVLADTPKPPTELNIPKANEMASSHYEAQPTPATPVSAETLSSLLAMIKRVPDDEASSQHKERLQQKVNNAALTFLARNALLDDRNQFLTKINDEGKLRRAAKGDVLANGKGEARVMSWEDLEKARAERAVKDAAKAEKAANKVVKAANKAAKEANLASDATQQVEETTVGKKKRGRKRKSAALEADAPEQGASSPGPKTKVARTEAQVSEEVTAAPYRAPVAKMY